MIRSILYTPREGKLFDGGAELIDEWERDATSQIWVAIGDEPPDEERELLSRRFGLHKLAITDALRERHPPKIEPFPDNTFILLKGLDAVSNSLGVRDHSTLAVPRRPLSSDAQLGRLGEYVSRAAGIDFRRG